MLSAFVVTVSVLWSFFIFLSEAPDFFVEEWYWEVCSESQSDERSLVQHHVFVSTQRSMLYLSGGTSIWTMALVWLAFIPNQGSRLTGYLKSSQDGNSTLKTFQLPPMMPVSRQFLLFLLVLFSLFKCVIRFVSVGLWVHSDCSAFATGGPRPGV